MSPDNAKLLKNHVDNYVHCFVQHTGDKRHLLPPYANSRIHNHHTHSHAYYSLVLWCPLLFPIEPVQVKYVVPSQ